MIDTSGNFVGCSIVFARTQEETGMPYTRNTILNIIYVKDRDPAVISIGHSEWFGHIELGNYIWKLKDNRPPYKISWRILNHA